MLPLLKERVNRVFSKGNHFFGYHIHVVASSSADISDELGSGPRLVVLPPVQATASKMNLWRDWQPRRCWKSAAIRHGSNATV